MPTDQLIQDYIRVAADVLAMCSRMQRNFWKTETDSQRGDMARAWGHAMARRPYPRQAYFEAVASFYASEQAEGGRQPGVADIIRHARQVVSGWESDPAKVTELNRYRAEKQQARREQLARSQAYQAELEYVTQPREWVPHSDSGYRAKLLAELAEKRKTREKGA